MPGDPIEARNVLRSLFVCLIAFCLVFRLVKKNTVRQRNVLFNFVAYRLATVAKNWDNYHVSKEIIEGEY